MGRFILKGSVFVIPFIILFYINLLHYKTDCGDLFRVGYIYKSDCYESDFNSGEKPSSKPFSLLSEIDLKKKHSFDIMTIGDSFSELNDTNHTYIYDLTSTSNQTHLHVDRYLSRKPIATLRSLANGDFFDSINVRYVVLQSVERLFMERCLAVNPEDVYTIGSVENYFENNVKPVAKNDMVFFSDALFKIPLSNILYTFKMKPPWSRAYRVETTDSLFSDYPQRLLFHHDDLQMVEINNDFEKVSQANAVLNELNTALKQKNIKLIVLINPDKYDIYYPYIKDKRDFPEPLFFDHLKVLPKDYLMVDSKTILKRKIESSKDVYYYGDAHSAVIGNKAIADGVQRLVEH